MTKSTEDKIQKIELETVKAVTELKADVKNLTEIIRELRTTIQEMSNNYVKRDEFTEKLIELDIKLRESRRAGRVHAILWSLLTAVITSLAILEINRLIK